MYKKIILATQNQHKLDEIRSTFSDYSKKNNLPIMEIIGLGELDQTIEIEETGSTFYENALIKASKIFETFNLPALSDDSGLVVPALNHEPGVYSSRYAGKAATDQDNNEKLVSELKKLNLQSTPAYFTTVLVLFDGGAPLFSEGICSGKILTTAKGTSGFGYDPLFVPNEENYKKLSFGEMTMKEKNQFSHRQKALTQLLSKLK